MSEQAERITREITLADACLVLEQKVLEATKVIEDLEGLGLVNGNGFHARQKIAQFAVEDLKSRWKQEDRSC